MTTLCETSLPRTTDSVAETDRAIGGPWSDTGKGWDAMASTEEGWVLRATRQDVVSAWVFYACLLIALWLLAVTFDIHGGIADRDDAAAFLEEPVRTIDGR